jgi:hypothetical protein
MEQQQTCRYIATHPQQILLLFIMLSCQVIMPRNILAKGGYKFEQSWQFVLSYMDQPTEVATDPDGNVFVVDKGKRRIQKLVLQGN